MRAITHEGHRVVAEGPFRIGRRVYSPDKMPCPVQCAGCVVLVNDRHGSGAMRLAFSDGSSWIYFVPDGASTSTQDVTTRPAEIDLTPLVRAAVNEALPALMPAPVRVVEHAAPRALPDMTGISELQNHVRVLATANLELAEQYARLLERVEFIEHNAGIAELRWENG